MKVGVFYFGCKVNQYDLAVITTALEKAGVTVDVGGIGDINIIAGCVVTHKAERDGLKLIRKIRRHYPHARIYLMGCLAVHRGQELLKKKLVDDVFTTHDEELMRLINILSEITGKRIENPSGVHLLEHSRAFLKVQDGCSYKCSFCLSKYTRLSLISYDIDQKVEEIRKIFLKGVSEVVITGINLMLWTDGIHDISYLLLNLADEAAKYGGRIRISSVYPSESIWKLTPLWKHPSVSNHLHISIQTASAKVLKDMNRTNYIPLLDEYFFMIREIDPGFGITGDFIVGFPTEDESDFIKTVEFVKKHLFHKLHVFPYSPRVGTEAYNMLPLPQDILKMRSKFLRNIGEQLKLEFVNKVNGFYRPAIFLKGKMPRVLFDNYLYMVYNTPFSGVKELPIQKDLVL